jgi:acetyltransferase
MRSTSGPYCTTFVLATGAAAAIRPIRPDDEPSMIRFHEGLSDRSVHLRYFQMLSLAGRTAHARLARICRDDARDEVALVAEMGSREASEAVIMGVARLQRTSPGGEAEFAVVVADRFQRLGVGEALMRQLIDVARREGVTRLRADILSENGAMRRLCNRVGIPVRPTPDPLVCVAELTL